MITLIKTAVLISIAFALAACLRIEAVRLKHPETGHIVYCGPYTGLNPDTFASSVIIQRGCVVDYKDQGYVRVHDHTGAGAL